MGCKAHVPCKGIIPIDCGHRNMSSAEHERLEADFYSTSLLSITCQPTHSEMAASTPKTIF